MLQEAARSDISDGKGCFRATSTYIKVSEELAESWRKLFDAGFTKEALRSLASENAVFCQPYRRVRPAAGEYSQTVRLNFREAFSEIGPVVKSLILFARPVSRIQKAGSGKILLVDCWKKPE